jgi:IclR family transcriptional regulator, pca regulon regulatory protein
MDALSPPVDADRRNWIAGLEKGLAIIQAFDIENSRLRASAAAKLTGMTRSSARRHLMMLTYLGFVATDGKSFWLTPKVLRLGSAYLHSARLPRIVQPFLQRLTGATQESAFVSILDGDELVYIARNGANRVMNTGFVIGARIPPFLASAGMAILSTQPSESVARLLADYQIKPFTPCTVTDKRLILAEIERATVDGYALWEQQLEPGVRGIAVPLKNHKAQTLGAISVTARIGEERPESAVRRLLPALQQAASDLRDVV